ncbi:MAG TPA: ABC transporter substrate-binding protein [Candidatus Binatia bacterium]|jgi:putative ABC transport system substrate-binding protein
MKIGNSDKAKIIALVLCAMLLALCVPAQAQQTAKIPRIGYLALRTSPTDNDEAFLQGLRDLGYIEGQNITIEYRWAAGKVDHLSSLAEDLVRLKADIIVASSTPAAQAAKNATRTIPIVMTGTADPVGTGLIASLAQPGGNVTGMSGILPELAGKRLELLRDVLPKLSRVAFLAHGGDPAHKLFVKEAQDAAEKFGMHIQPLVIGGPEEIQSAFSAMIRERAGALIVQPLFVGNLDEGRRIAALAAKHRLPTVSDGNQFADAGGLMFYGPDRLDQYRRCATYVDKILKGRKPADLPVEQPMRFEFVVNLKTAKQIGVPIPPSVLARANRVIR